MESTRDGYGRIFLVVPKDDASSATGIAAGSALVTYGDGSVDGGLPFESTDYMQVYYEGNVYGASNLRTLADRARHAAGRMVQTAPTIAKRLVPPEEMVVAGTLADGWMHCSPGEMLVEPDEDGREALARWLGSDVEAVEAELRASSG